MSSSFRYLIADDRWEWSDAVARMHGYKPGTVTPTTELILSHKHPEDKPAVAEIIDQVLRHGAPFSSRHRIVDTEGNIRLVVVVGDRLTDADGQVIGTTGFYIDITEVFDADLQRTVFATSCATRRSSIADGAVADRRLAVGLPPTRIDQPRRGRTSRGRLVGRFSTAAPDYGPCSRACRRD
jgi:PAS domain S-box-containing protein